ncbi:hypothetical protein HK103_006410 [Boothiomyces macroporosus]|uniref:Uncharacterized protein n=1 Tax=Boothiomyces macroporosus TaxID=261099 RepID=A0AAD5UQG5_9FUNG|nr:hypothetical protein HK103_006410 [Boothiomyces macroporosus]
MSIHNFQVNKVKFLDSNEWINKPTILSIDESQKKITILDCEFSLQNSTVLYLPNKEYWFKIIQHSPIRFITSLQRDDQVLYIILERMMINIKKLDQEQYSKLLENPLFENLNCSIESSQISNITVSGSKLVNGYPMMETFKPFDIIVEKNVTGSLMYLVKSGLELFWVDYSKDWTEEFQDKVREFETKEELPSVIDTSKELQGLD